MFTLPKNTSQKGAASLIVVALLLVGITAAVYLTQTRTNFLPQAAEDPQKAYIERAEAALKQLPSDSSYRIMIHNVNALRLNDYEKRPSFSVIKLWIAAAAFKEYGLKDTDINKLVTSMLINSDNSSTNDLINKLSFRVINNYISESGYKETYLGRHMEQQSYTDDNTTSARDAVSFIESLKDNQIVNAETSEKIKSILSQRSSSSDPFYPNPPDVKKTFIGKSGILGEGRNDAGSFLTKSGKRIDYAIFIPTGGNANTQKIANILQVLYDDISSNPPSQGSTVQDSPCTNPTHITHCQNTKNEHGSNATGKCFLLNKDPSKPKCEYTTDFKPPSGATGPCNQRDNSACPNGCELVRAKLASDSREVQYSQCKTAGAPAQQPGTQPRPAGPAGGPAAAAPAAAQPQSSTCAAIQDPWDIDKKGDSGKVKYVLEESAKASGAAASTQSTPNSAADHAKQAYINAFNSAYASSGAGKGFGFSISQAKKARSANGSETYCADNSATLVRDAEANNTAIHAYVLTKSPGIDWNTAKSNGLVQEAISALRLTGVTPSSVSTPGTAAAPQRLTIDPGVAVDCGSDLDGTKIPCYKMGVFASYDQLTATEAQAAIATKRYEKSQLILNEARGKVDEAILDAAQKKLNLAQEKAKACMPK